MPPYSISEAPPNLLMLQTGPGFGMALGIRVDRSHVEGVAGTIGVLSKPTDEHAVQSAVDYALRQRYLDELTAQPDANALWTDLWQDRFSGRIKLWLTHRLLQARKGGADLFTTGRYVPLTVEGAHRDNVLAFARTDGETWYVVAVPLHPAQLCPAGQADVLTIDWQDTRVTLPADAPAQWINQLTYAPVEGAGAIALGPLFGQVPVALLKA